MVVGDFFLFLQIFDTLDGEKQGMRDDGAGGSFGASIYTGY